MKGLVRDGEHRQPRQPFHRGSSKVNTLPFPSSERTAT
jgi:hypothetical protein